MKRAKLILQLALQKEEPCNTSNNNTPSKPENIRGAKTISEDSSNSPYVLKTKYMSASHPLRSNTPQTNPENISETGTIPWNSTNAQSDSTEFISDDDDSSYRQSTETEEYYSEQQSNNTQNIASTSAEESRRTAQIDTSNESAADNEGIHHIFREFFPTTLIIETDEGETEVIYIQYIVDDDDSSNQQPTETKEYNAEKLLNAKNTASTLGHRGSSRRYRPRKKHFCYFCKTSQTHVVRHLLAKHRNEPLVKKASEGDRETRNEIMKRLRKVGHLDYNLYMDIRNEARNYHAGIQFFDD